MESRQDERAPVTGDAWSAADDAHFQRHFQEESERSAALGTPSDLRAGRWSYDEARPAYQLGLRAGRDPANAGRSYSEVDAELERAWASNTSATAGDWKRARPLARAAFDRGARLRGAIPQTLPLGGTPAHDRPTFSDPNRGPADRALGAAEPERAD